MKKKNRYYLSARDRYSGTYMLGVQGVGKSAQLVNMILSDINAGRSTIVFDPHDDLITNCMKRLPEHRLHKVYRLDMTDEQYPFGVNVFSGNDISSGLKLAHAVDQVMRIFEAVWPDVLKQVHLPRYLRNAVQVLLANPGSTLVDMRKFFLDDAVRARMLKNVTDPTVVDFWQMEYSETSSFDQRNRVQPLLGRLEILFVGRSIVRNILGQAENGIDFRQAIENGEAIFIHLPTQSLTLDARLIGTMLMVLISRAVYSFADTPETDRHGVSLYIDEFQNFVSQDIERLFTQGRKFGMRLVCTHQTRSQLPEYLREATMSARTKLCFRLTPDDAREMAPLFPQKQARVRPENIDPHPIKWLLTYPIDEYHVRLFVDRFLRPLQSKRKGGMVKFAARTGLATAMQGPYQMHEVWDPTLHLDQLLYEVMTTGNAHLLIPRDIVLGLSGCGHTFYHIWQRTLNKDWWLGPDVSFPPELVITRPDGSHMWTRRPDDSREELAHCIYLIRATMRYLAEHPLGEATTLSTSEVAAQLMELPNRQMYVRAGDEVALLRTEDMETPVPAYEYEERVQLISTQTHERYCKPKEEVEEQLGMNVNKKQANVNITADDVNETDSASTPRWETY